VRCSIIHAKSFRKTENGSRFSPAPIFVNCKKQPHRNIREAALQFRKVA
jgi:hypothetical protein